MKFDKIEKKRKGISMSSIVIYSEGHTPLLKDFCERIIDSEVTVKKIDEIKQMESTGASVAVIDLPLNKLKDLSMIMKFPLPILIVCDEIPEKIAIRGNSYDFILSPINRYELNIRLKNLLKIKELKEKIGSLSETDELTGLHNRKFLLERLEEEMSRAKRYKLPLSCILFDIDFFKVINDMYGYECGDVLLKKLSEMLSNLGRKEDIITRYGDEEFMVILPNTKEENAFIFAERFRKDVEKLSFIPTGETERHPVKVSGGIATYPYMNNIEENANSLIRYTEHALYNAKKRGKNKVVMFSQVNLDF